MLDDSEFTLNIVSQYQDISRIHHQNSLNALVASVFALVTVSGCLIVYNMFVPSRPIVKISAHAGDATTLDWHPTKPYVLATGGAGDRCVKSTCLCSKLQSSTLFLVPESKLVSLCWSAVWNLESTLVMAKDDSNMAANSNTANSRSDSIATESSSDSGYV